MRVDQPRGHRSPIDLFFRSVAERLGDGFAVILSGAGSDGAIGVRAVKETGGIILVQDPNEAEHDRISDNVRNRASLSEALGERCRWITFDAEHFLLAEPCRDDVILAMAGWVDERSET